jgi:thiol-disulfide isomerase/thioredoxin
MQQSAPSGLILIPLLALAMACGTTQSAGQTGGGTEEEEPIVLASLELDDLKGAPIAFDQMAGRVVMISFWATFCKPCKSEMPFLQKLHEQYAGQGLSVVSISLDTPETEAQVKPFIQRNHYTFPVGIDRQSAATQLLNSKGVLPYLVVFDRKGKVAKRKDGFSVGDQPALEELVKGLLNAP